MKTTQQTLQMRFLESVCDETTLFQLGLANKVLAFDKDIEKFLEKNQDKDLYFLSGVNKSLEYKRATDDDIAGKKYVYFDFDIRKEQEVTDEYIKEMGRCWGQVLNETDLNDWRFIVFSGNGLHVYFCSESLHAFNKNSYSVGYDKMRNKISSILDCEADESCKNLARIARFPGSYNNKKEKKLVEIVAYQDCFSSMFTDIKEYGEKEYERLKDIESEEKALRDYLKLNMKYKSDDLIQDINKIPVSDEVLRDYPQWNFDGKNFWEPNGARATSAFVSMNKENVLIISDSRWFSDINYTGVGTFLYRREKSKLTNKETYEYFIENYPQLKKHEEKQEVKERKVYTWGTEQLDDNFALIKRGVYTVIAGETGDGKTTYAVFQAIKNAKMGNKAVYISLEMDTNEIIDNIARSYAGITIREERLDIIPSNKKEAYESKFEEIKNMENLVIIGFRKGNDIDVESITKTILEHEADIAYVDNLDLVIVKGVEDNIQRQTLVSRKIASLTTELQIPIVLLHHYRKKGRDTKTRSVDDIAGSSKITHDADRIVQLVRNFDDEATIEEKSSLMLYLNKARGYTKALRVIYFSKGDFYDSFPSSPLLLDAQTIFSK